LDSSAADAAIRANVAKPLIIALLAFLAPRYLGGEQKEGPPLEGTRPAPKFAGSSEKPIEPAV
jgi:hypothetical protein